MFCLFLCFCVCIMNCHGIDHTRMYVLIYILITLLFPPVWNIMTLTTKISCCYWGRGTIQTTGICQYGKLNYYLGARAHAEGRHARYPTIDFCTNPQSICSTGKEQPSESSIEWITGLFRWIDSVQSYDYYNGNSNGQEDTSWNYIQKLQEFVEGGMVDGLFLHSVSAIVTQGCHEAPCPSVEGTVVTMDDANLRYSYFLQVLEALGLPVDALRQS